MSDTEFSPDTDGSGGPTTGSLDAFKGFNLSGPQTPPSLLKGGMPDFQSGQSLFPQVFAHVAMGGDPADLHPSLQNMAAHANLLLKPDPPLGTGVFGDVRKYLADTQLRDYSPPAKGDQIASGVLGDDLATRSEDTIPLSANASPAATGSPRGEGRRAPPSSPHQLGDTSMTFETGFGPGQGALAAGKVSTGAGAKGRRDPGGVSYGAFQLSSAKGMVQDFLKSPEGVKWAEHFGDLDPKLANGDFAQAWKAIAAKEGQEFYDAQKEYVKRSNYDPVVSAILQTTGLDVNNQPKAVQDAVWSAAVQHGSTRFWAPRIVKGVSEALDPSDPRYNKILVNRLYDFRMKKFGFEDRYERERAAVLGGLEKW